MDEMKKAANRIINRIVQKISRSKTSTMSNLPEEILFEIFLLLPAEVLHDVLGTVCRRWCDLIRDPVFIKAHLSRSPVTPFSIECKKTHSEIIFLRKEQYTATQIGKNYLTHGDGLFLYYDLSDRSILNLINPVTNKIISLPCLPLPCSPASHIWALACSRLTREYKVVFRNKHSKTTYILTVGVDKEWRKMQMEVDIDIDIGENYCAQGIYGIIYWYTCSTCTNYLIALDVEKETFCKVDFPEECRGVWVYNTNSDKFFSFAVEKCSEWCHEFWELVDYKNVGGWRKVRTVDLERKTRELDEIGIDLRRIVFPVAVLKSGDEVVYRVATRKYITYNLKTGRFSRWPDSKLPLMFTHVDNLVVL